MQSASSRFYEFGPFRVDTIDVALIYAGLGDKDGAFAWLGKAYEARDPQLIWVNVEPELRSLRADTRFKDLLHRMNLAQ